MTKRLMAMLMIAAYMFFMAGSTVTAEESDRENKQSGQTNIIYSARERPVFEEIPKGNGELDKNRVVKTGDEMRTGTYLILVIASAGSLMIIIYNLKRKRRKRI